MGTSYMTNKGNRVTLQDNGLLVIKTKNGSARIYNVDEIVEGLKYLREMGLYESRKDEHE